MSLLSRIWQWLWSLWVQPPPVFPHIITHGDRCWDVLPCGCGGHAVKWAVLSGKWVLRCAYCGYNTHRYRLVGQAVHCWNRRQRIVAEQKQRATTSC